MPEQLLSPEFLTKIRQLELVSRRIFAGRMKGERRTRQRGTSVEFADYRNYTFGDEPRFVDWNTYGRLEKLFLKLFVEEEDLFVYLLVDTSRSMSFGDPSKLLQAKRIAAALSYVSLLGMDRVSIAGIGADMGTVLPPKRGRSATREVFAFLESLQAEGGTSLEAAARRFTLQMPRNGLVIVLSDFLDKAGYEGALSRLLHKRCEIFVMQILAEEELHPELSGDLRLVDAEDGAVAEITVTPALLTRYSALMEAYSNELKGFCVKRGIGYLRTSAAIPFEEVVLRALKGVGLVR